LDVFQKCFDFKDAELVRGLGGSKDVACLEEFDRRGAAIRIKCMQM